MAIDTTAKRRSATFALMPFYPASIYPDGTLVEADRASSSWVYGGLYTGGSPPGSPGCFMAYMRIVGRQLWQ